MTILGGLLIVLMVIGAVAIWLVFFSGGPPHGHWKDE